MRKKIYLTVALVLSLATLAAASLYVAQRKGSQRRGPAAQRPAAAQRNANASAQAGPLRSPDPNRAPRAEVDDALYTNEEFFGVSASVMRPYDAALERVSSLSARYPKDAQLHLHASRLSERLGRFDQAAAEMGRYVELKNRTPDSLARLADFYHNRARYADEVRTLQELARVSPIDQRGRIYKRAAHEVRSHTLKEFKPSDFFAELVAADPSSIQPVKDYVEELELGRQPEQALSVLATFQPKFPSELAYFLRTRARILEAGGNRSAAEEVYGSSFDPAWPRAVAADYYSLLRRFGRYRVVRRSLQDGVRSGATDLQTFGRLFSVYAYEGNYEQAARLLRELEERRAGRAAGTQGQAQGGAQPQPVRPAGWTSQELETSARLFISIGHFDQASRYLYTLYLLGGLQAGTPVREEALFRLFGTMIDAAGAPTRVAGGDLSFYKDVAEVDQHPGFMNGVLSLVLADTNPAEQFATQQEAAAGYFNKAFAYRVFTAFRQEYPQSKHMGEMYLGVLNVFSSLGEHRLAIDAGREFQKSFPSSPEYADVALRLADSYVALKDRAGERAVLAELLDRLARSRPRGVPLVPIADKRWRYGISPRDEYLIDRARYNIEAYSDTYEPSGDEGGSESADEESDYDSEAGEDRGPEQGLRRVTYGDVLERYISSLASEEKKTETVAFFWGEIKKHPKEEGLYERFLRWLGQAQIVNEQLKAYNSAIRQFDSNTWYHRLGRWYVRQKRGRELARYSRQLIDIFDEDEAKEYILRFAGYGATGKGDELDWDERLAFDLYSYAHGKFPRNLFFVRGMLTHLQKHDRARWERLSTEYYFADRSIREPYLAWLSKQGQLRDRYRVAVDKAKPAAPSFTYSIFKGDAAIWLSHHDEGLDAYRRLVSLYPGEPQYADRLADLTRSFGQQDAKLFEESATVLARMADIYPSERRYRIKAGEVYAQLGDFNRAAEQWNRLVALEPGQRETYLEVATVFWDYYQFDQAIRVFKELRAATGDQSIYAYRLGAVYEAKGDIDSAIAEYVKVLPEPGDGRETVARRLAQLSRRPGLSEKIAAAYNNSRAASPSDWEAVIGYATYLNERGQQAEALAVLRGEVARSNDVAFLETVRDLFRSALRPEDEQQVIARLAAVARDERESMMYRLQLAAFFDRQGRKDSAIQIIDKLTSDYPTNLGVVEESARFYWRAGMTDRAIDLYRKTLARARGSNARTLTLQLARRQAEAGKLEDAEATLGAYYRENRMDAQVFGELAGTLAAGNKLPELAALYQSAFRDVREAGLPGDEAKARTAELRLGMIRTLDGLGKYQDAVDQHIEIINASPEDQGVLAEAIDYAERRNMIDRLVGYYEKLSNESNRNYRWQLVLGRIYERRGNLAGASDQYRLATANEPQRPDLRYALASTLARQRRFDEAIAILREGWTLAGRDPEWLIEVARLQIQQGKRDEAIQTAREVLDTKKNASVHDKLKMAMMVSEWGLYPEAVRIYELAYAQFPGTLKDESSGYHYIPGYVKALVRSEPVGPAYQKLDRLRSQFKAIADNSQGTDGYKAKTVVDSIDASLRAEFGRGVIEHATTAEVSALVSTLRSGLGRLTTYDDREELRRLLGIARGANLVEVEEQILTQLKDAGFKVRTDPADGRYHNELRALLAFYDDHAAFARAAQMLAAEYSRDPHKDRFDFQNQIAIRYRLAGDRERELEALRAAYASASGGLTMNTSDWVDRYLRLLHEGGMREELARLASSYSPHQLQLINFLIERGEKVLARAAIAGAKQSDGWIASRSAEVGLLLKDTSPETEELFRRALFIKPIGEMLARSNDAGRALVGEDWFIAARNYGYWLGLSPSREGESRDYTPAEIEGRPTSALAQLELAAYYIDRKDTARASGHVSLASELEPGSREVSMMRGVVALARGDRKAALEAWSSLLSGRPTVASAEGYARMMADNGFFREALPQLEAFFVSYINRTSQALSESDRVEGLKPLVRELAGRAGADARLAGEVSAFFQRVIGRVPSDISLGRMLVEENLLPEPALTPIYRAMHQRLAEVAAAVQGSSEYENGYSVGGSYIYPASALSDWRRRFMDHLIRVNALDEARLLASSIRQEVSDVLLATASDSEDSSTSETIKRYDWLALASALIELRSGRDAKKAVADLRLYCGLDNAAGHARGSHAGEGGDTLNERCLKAYALLSAEKREADADALLYDAYSAAARSRHSNDASIAGLAELEARRGRTEEAVKLISLLVSRSTDNSAALKLAAETAARINRFDLALEFREQIARANPNDSANKLELARVVFAAGRNSEALDRIAALIGERATPNSVRAQAAEIVGEIVRADRAQAARAASVLEQRAGQGSAGALLAMASAAEASGRQDEARSLLGRLASGPLASVAQMKLGLLALASGNEPAAAGFFERALYLDASGMMSDPIRFRAAGPRAQLILLYSRTGRDLAALRLIEGEDEGRSALMRSLARAGSSSEGGGEGSNAAFDPQLDSSHAGGNGLLTLSELNEATSEAVHDSLLAALAESAGRLGQYERAVAMQRLRAFEATKPEEKAAIQRRISEVIADERARRLRDAFLPRINQMNALDSIYAARVLGDR
ncbi:MAG TPA: tetratricopeptide repeat protein [Blastocatellia bacterium]|nr:tetratricopeptide repeat protein [Blastocatellia bacterium]